MFSKICVVRIEGGFIACVKDLRLPYWVGRPTAPRIFTHLHRFNLIRRHQNWMKNPIKMYPKTTMARLPKHYTYFHFWILFSRLSPTIGDTANADQSVQVPCRVSCGHQCGPLCRSLWLHVWSHCGSPDVSNPKVHALFRKVFTYYVYNACVNQCWFVSILYCVSIEFSQRDKAFYSMSFTELWVKHSFAIKPTFCSDLAPWHFAANGQRWHSPPNFPPPHQTPTNHVETLALDDSETCELYLCDTNWSKSSF